MLVIVQDVLGVIGDYLEKIKKYVTAGPGPGVFVACIMYISNSHLSLSLSHLSHLSLSLSST